MDAGPISATVDVLTQIWQRVLQRSPIGPEEKFYRLGGTDQLADSVFAEIAQVFGRELPSATICYAPTIASLAALLDQPALPRFSPFVPLKAGSVNPPILITHGVGGRASFSELARHMQTAHPIYGIQARGVDGLEPPFHRIEDMAEYYLDALNQLQPQGSCALIGYSFGGLVAFEMARRLAAAGKNVALLVLVDTYPHPRYLPTGQRMRLFSKRVLGHIHSMAQMPIRRAMSYFTDGVERRLHIAEAHRLRTLPPETSRLSFARTTARNRDSDFEAMRHYRPQFYRGKIKFVRPERNSYLPTDPTAIWKKMVTELEVETVPGDHLGMIGTHFDTLAAVLTRCVREAFSE
ncbi:MAG: alpha/beta fold hydrolase [Candidatus Sulfotelmatobacter sp.]